MDDSNTSANDINLNPDMMTTQSSMPIMTPTQTSSNENTSDPLTHSDPGSKGVIDITPGATGDDHPSKVVDITPVDSVPSTNIEPTLPVAAPTSEPTPSLPPTPGEVSIPTAVTSPTTLDITPNSSEVETPNQVNPAFQDTHDDEFSSNSSGGHLADLASSAPAVTDPVAATTLTPSQPAISTENTTTTLPVTSPVETTPLTSSTTPTPVISDNPTPSSTTSAPAVEVSLPPAATASPFAEDPDGVKTNK